MFDKRKELEEKLRAVGSGVENISQIVQFPTTVKEVTYKDEPVTDGLFGSGNMKKLTLVVVYENTPELAESRRGRLESIKEELEYELQRIREEMEDE